jgi:hypothetical protein
MAFEFDYNAIIPHMSNLISIFALIISIFALYFNFLKGSNVICIAEIRRAVFNEIGGYMLITGDCIFINKGNRAGIIKDLKIFPAFNNLKKPIIKSRAVTENEKSRGFEVGITKEDIFERIFNRKWRYRTEYQGPHKKILSFGRHKTLPYKANIPYLFEHYSEFKLINGTKLELPVVVGDKESVYTSFSFIINFDYLKYQKYKNSISVTGVIVSYNTIRGSKIIHESCHRKFEFDEMIIPASPSFT